MTKGEQANPTVTNGDEYGAPKRASDRTVAPARRRAPRFFVVDSWGELLVCSPELERPLLERSRRKLHEVLERVECLSETVFEHLDDDTLLRLVPLPRGGLFYYAVFVEPLKRGGIAAAIKRFGVTKRETEVLEALMAGLSSAAIAERLSISEGTVAEHVKNLFKKTGTNKRSELVARIFRDIAYEPDKASVATLKGEEAGASRP